MRTTPSRERREPLAEQRAARRRPAGGAGTRPPDPGTEDRQGWAGSTLANGRPVAIDSGAISSGATVTGPRWRTITDPPAV